MPSRLADRLYAARRHRFVGRADHCNLFQAALRAMPPSFSVLHIFGPGGTGKTTLLHEFMYLCADEQISTTYLDARTIEPTPRAFLTALHGRLKLETDTDLLGHLAHLADPHVLFIDTFEALHPLERWLRDEFLPLLSTETIFVTAGRHPLSPAWRADPGWTSLIHTIPLRNLNRDESTHYLQKIGIPGEKHPTILDFTNGHPLALSLVADVLLQTPDDRFEPATNPNVIKTLLDRFIEHVPSQTHRLALEACAITRFMTEQLMTEMIPESQAHDLFAWLRQLSFIKVDSNGLFLHDLAREVLVADLKWRNAERYTQLHHKARKAYSRRLTDAPLQEQRKILTDYIFLHRDNPVVRPFFVELQSQWSDGIPLTSDTLTTADHAMLEAMVSRHEGALSAALARYWIERQPERWIVYRNSDDDPIGCMMTLSLDQTTDADAGQDPAVRQTLQYLNHHAPLRTGEKASLFRFWLCADAYQGISQIQSLIFVQTVRHYLMTPGLAYTFLPCADPDFWAMIFAIADLHRLPEADFEVGQHTYGVFGHDWRVVSPASWLDMLAVRDFSSVQSQAPTRSRPALIVLSKPDFEKAVRNTFRNLGRPHALRGNPLLHSRMVEQISGPDADEADRIAVLCTLLKETADFLKSAPRLSKYYPPVDRTYLRPAPSQEVAAERLDLPFSTFRRHLKKGLLEITERLWQREIHG